MPTKDVSKQYDEEIGNNYINSTKNVNSPRDVWAHSKVAEYCGDMTDKVLLDAGCGSGRDIKQWLNQNAKQVLAFDSSELMLENAKAACQDVDEGRVTFKKGALEKIPFEDSCADVVASIFAIHYVANMDDGYRELYRVLKPGGRACFATDHPVKQNNHKPSPFKGQEIVGIPIWNGTVTVHYPSHTLSDYFSPYLLTHFTLDHVEEFFPTDDQGNVLKDPVTLCYSITKR